MELSKHLARLRKKSRLTQSKVAEYLTEHGPKKYTFKIISQWETGVSEPSVEAFLHLCDLYGVIDIPEEFGFPYKSKPTSAATHFSADLNRVGRERLAEYRGLLARDPAFREKPVQPEREVFQIRLFDLPASAGTGVFLDGDDYEEIETEDAAAGYADYAIRIKGDSMSPRFEDGDIVYVEETQGLDLGDIGIFTLNGEGFCKKKGKGSLVSINPEYKPIQIAEYDSLYVLGKVIS